LRSDCADLNETENDLTVLRRIKCPIEAISQSAGIPGLGL
jgi:hypothetical protein